MNVRVTTQISLIEDQLLVEECRAVLDGMISATYRATTLPPRSLGHTVTSGRSGLDWLGACSSLRSQLFPRCSPYLGVFVPIVPAPTTMKS